MGLDIISACYALSVTAGGVIGYVKAGSISSLVAGLTFGGLMAFGTYQTSVNENNYILSFATAAVLGGVMGVRFYNSGKFMPAGLIASLSILMVLRFTLKNILHSH